MKKAVVLFLLTIILLISSCVSDTAASGGVVMRGERPYITDLESYYKDEEIVYVTKSGKKYHKEGCPHLRSSKIMISLEQALMEGKEPCSRCFWDNASIKEPD